MGNPKTVTDFVLFAIQLCGGWFTRIFYLKAYITEFTSEEKAGIWYSYQKIIAKLKVSNQCAI